jgi:hypothetical protein
MIAPRYLRVKQPETADLPQAFRLFGDRQVALTRPEPSLISRANPAHFGFSSRIRGTSTTAAFEERG